MAGNLKGLGGIKGLALRHGEKVVILVVGVLAAWLAMKSFSMPRLEDKFQASKLHEAITQTNTAVQSATWPSPTDEAAKEVYSAQAIDAKADALVDVKLYQPEVPHGIDAPIVAATTPRDDPKLLNAVGVRATGGAGLFAFLDEKIRKEQALRMAAEAEQAAKKQAEEAAKQAREGAAGGPGEGGRRNRLQEPGYAANLPVDPKHPKRRALAGMARPAGVPLQGGERIEQAYWACVVAKVPIREQLKRYQDVFEKAKMGFDMARDMPQYKGFLVQRAEVVPGKEIQEADWKPVPVYDAQHQSIVANKPLHPSAMAISIMNQLYAAAASFWAGMSPDVIDPRYSDYVLTSPLPPLVGRDWGSEASHPDFPSLAETPPLEQEMPTVAPTATAKSETPGNADVSPFSNAAAAGTQPGEMPAMGPRMGPGMGPGMGYGPGMGPGMGYGPGAGFGRMGGEEGRGGMGYGPGMGPGMMGPGMMGAEGGRGSYSGPMGGGANSPRTSLPKGVDFLLLRFFDYTVEPGKRYRYRVSLVLADPNYAMPENVLAPAVLDRQHKESVDAKGQKRPRPDFRRIEGWSDPSPVVGIPLAGGAKLVDVKPPSAEKIGDEPAVTLLVNSFDKDSEGNAIQAAIKRENVHRGDVVNFVEDAEYVVAVPPSIDTHPGFKFATGITLIDARGGEKAGKNLAMPSQVLLMGPSGNLYVRQELDDKAAVEFHEMLFMKDRTGAGPGFGSEGPGFGPGGRGQRGGVRGRQ